MKAVKKVGWFFLTAILMIACQKLEQDDENRQKALPELLTKTYDGCFNAQEKGAYPIEQDTLYIEQSGDMLILHVNINRNCSNFPMDSVIIYQGNVNIFISDQNAPYANCICTYKFNYNFKDFSGFCTFNVYYKDYGTERFMLWKSANYHF